VIRWGHTAYNGRRERVGRLKAFGRSECAVGRPAHNKASAERIEPRLGHVKPRKATGTVVKIRGKRGKNRGRAMVGLSREYGVRRVVRLRYRKSIVLLDGVGRRWYRSDGCLT
jgi:hypothetical protein